MSKINLRKQTSVSVSNPGTGQLSVYFDNDGRMTSKDEFGAVITYGTLSGLTGEIDAEINVQKGIANGIASLGSDSKLTRSQSPTIITYPVASQAAMLALSAITGELALRSDTLQTYILNGTDPTVLANWSLVLTPVTSVAGKNGVVTLVKADVGLSNVANVDTTTTANIADSTDKRFVTDNQRDIIGKYTSTTSASVIKTVVNTTPSLVNAMTVIPGVGTHMVNFNCQHATSTSSPTAQAAADLTTLYNTLSAMTPTVTNHPLVFGAETLLPGIYRITGAASITGSITLTLDGQGDPNALFVFQIYGSFSTGASAVVNLINGAISNNVFWVAEGAGSIAASTTLRGTVISLAAIDLGAGTILDGRIASTGGALSDTTSTITRPTGTSVVNLMSIDNFIMFTASGAVANTGVSSFTGDIGTNLGAITGFSGSTVNGNFYTPSSSSYVITWSVFSNGVIVPFSSRSESGSTVVTAETAVLSAVVTTLAGQVVEIRVKVDSGSVTVGNRILTTLRVG